MAAPAVGPAQSPGTDPKQAVPGVTTPPKRRGTELLMLAFAVLITLAAQCIVDITVTQSLNPEIATFGVWFAGLWLVAHLVVRRFAPYADPLLLPCAAVLTAWACR